MPWRATHIVTDAAGLTEAATSQFDEITADYEDDVRANQRTQFDAALAAAHAVIASGSLGAGPFTVHLGGHATEGYEPEDGAESSLSVNIIGRRFQATAE